MKNSFLIILFLPLIGLAQKVHPNLVLTKSASEEIRLNLGNFELMEHSIDLARTFIEEALVTEIDVPIPIDAGGGYTHERHKQNYNEMYKAGILFQISGEDKYAKFIKDMLDKYAKIYPTLGKHPQGKQQTPGRMFWQSLNETVWLLHTIQAYDCVYDWLSEEDRQNYETNIFRPMVKFFIEECTHEFDLIHNHGTWIVAAVGMAGLVLDEDEWVQKSLYGSKLDKQSGFLAQLDLLFSPDGYYTEGGYYVRYALWPFFIYAEVLYNNMPNLNIYGYRDSILKKALYSALQVTYTNGEFIPINDALKEKTWLSSELIFAVDFVYDHYGNDAQLLSIAKLHGEVALSGSGLATAKGIQENPNPPNFNWKSIEFTDGQDGKQGGVGILRFGNHEDQQTVLLKYGTHGLSHGHYDKLQYLYYDQGREIIQDYGAVRFLNVVQKWGGRYLPENKTWGRLTVAHNTIVVDENTQFKGKRNQSQAHHSERFTFSSDNSDLQYMSAKESNAYPGVNMHRTIILVNDKALLKPVSIDIYRVESDEEHKYDLPFYYKGQFIYSNFEYKAETDQLSKMGESNGYQHLWKTAKGKPGKTSQLTWLNGERFYSIVSNTDDESEIFFTMIGAEDPNFNLRNDPGFMFRRNDDSFTFVNLVEAHGVFNPIKEFTKDSYSTFDHVEVLKSDEEYTIVSISGQKGIDWIVALANDDPKKESDHNIKIEKNEINWKGPIAVIKKEGS